LLAKRGIMTNLKPCPLCGKEARYVVLPGAKIAQKIVTCSNPIIFPAPFCILINRNYTEEYWNNFYCWKKVEQLNLQLDDMLDQN